ncbi:hypothetical protein K438DRAFT_1965631 [Mycena galopus ATCC 62051]|nr:hypothetical protein K438DRAFT_1965631 [Mycena galopus ATCC 62051]
MSSNIGDDAPPFSESDADAHATVFPSPPPSGFWFSSNGVLNWAPGMDGLHLDTGPSYPWLDANLWANNFSNPSLVNVPTGGDHNGMSGDVPQMNRNLPSTEFVPTAPSGQEGDRQSMFPFEGFQTDERVRSKRLFGSFEHSSVSSSNYMDSASTGEQFSNPTSYPPGASNHAHDKSANTQLRRPTARTQAEHKPGAVQCDQCGTWVSRPKDLPRHKRGHAGGQKVQCGRCGVEISRQDALKRHQKSAKCQANVMSG